MPVKLRLRFDSTAARGIIQRQECGPLKHIETRLLWLQAKHEKRMLTVVKELTETNTADGSRRRCRQRGGTVPVWETTTVQARSACGIRTMGTSRSVARDPTLSVDRDFDAANVRDQKTWMERLELVEQGLSKLRAQLWLTIVKCFVKCFFCSMRVASAHAAQTVWFEEAC